MSKPTREQLDAFRRAKSKEELIAMAKEAGLELTPEQAEALLGMPAGELSEAELENISGGGVPMGDLVFLMWKDTAEKAGFPYYLGKPCPSCYAEVPKGYSWYGVAKPVTGLGSAKCSNCGHTAHTQL